MLESNLIAIGFTTKNEPLIVKSQRFFYAILCILWLKKLNSSSVVAHGYDIFKKKEDSCVKVVLDPWAA
jgi:hypothetical protein